MDILTAAILAATFVPENATCGPGHTIHPLTLHEYRLETVSQRYPVGRVDHPQRAFKDSLLPRAYIEKSREFREQRVGIDPSHSVWSHVCGTDLVRDIDGQMYVLEDNLRVPSGVSYMLENREVMIKGVSRTFRGLRHSPHRRLPRPTRRLPTLSHFGDLRSGLPQVRPYAA
jgi:hypothetical protein